MNLHFAKNIKTLTSVVGLFALTACGPLISLGNDGPADEVFSLRYPAAFKNASATGPIIYVDGPQLVEGIDGRGVAVRLAGNKRTVLEGAAWAAHLSDLVRDYVIHALASQTNVNLVSEGGLDIEAGCRLGIKVWAMEFVPGKSASEDQVQVAMQFSLVRLADSKLLAHPTFSKNEAVISSDGSGVVAAFNAAMESASHDYSRWLNERAGECGRN